LITYREFVNSFEISAQKLSRYVGYFHHSEKQNGPHKTLDWVVCGLRAVGLTWLDYIFKKKNYHSEIPSVHSFTSWKGGSDGYFLSCWHFQYPIQPLFNNSINIFASTQGLFLKCHKYI